jgi:hypothetical protein
MSNERLKGHSMSIEGVEAFEETRPIQIHSFSLGEIISCLDEERQKAKLNPGMMV